MEHSAPLPEKEDGGDEEVMSEVHLGCPPGFSGPHISRFTISLSHGNSHLLPLLPSFTLLNSSIQLFCNKCNKNKL